MKCKICGESATMVQHQSYNGESFYVEHKCRESSFFGYIGKHCETLQEAIDSVPEGIFDMDDDNEN